MTFESYAEQVTDEAEAIIEVCEYAGQRIDEFKAMPPESECERLLVNDLEEAIERIRQRAEKILEF